MRALRVRVAFALALTWTLPLGAVAQAVPQPQAVPQAPSPPDADTLASVTGVVRLGDASGEPVAGAAVQVRQGTTLHRVRSGPAGRYLIEGLRPGGAELLAVHLSGHPLSVSLDLPEGRRIAVDLALTPRPIELSAIHVRAAPDPGRPVAPSSTPEASRSTIRLEALGASSGIVESGLASALGAEEPTGPDRVLYLRGSTIDARLVLLDGAPILSPFHVAGLVEPFPAQLLGQTDRYLGGAPASYSDGVSYVLDMKTRAAPAGGDPLEVRVDGLTMGATLQSRLPTGGSIVASGRWLHGAQEALRGDALPYGYREALVRAGFAPARGHDLRATWFLNDESVSLELPGAGTRRTEWGNRALAIGYDLALGEVEAEVTASASRYESTLPVALENPVLARGVGDRVRASAEASVPALGGSIRLGGSVERLEFVYGVREVDPTVVSATERLGAGTTSVGGFGEWDGHVLSRLHLRAGIRADRLAAGSGVRLSPRVSATLSLPDGAELSTAAGLYHQVLPAPGLRAISDPSAAPGQPDVSLSWDPSLPVAKAAHWLVGLRQDLGAGVSVGLTGFVKRFSSVGPGLERANASGTEIQVARNGERLRGWLGYGLSWFWADEGPSGSTRFDSRHLVSAGFDGDLGAGVALRGSLGYGSGLPMTAVGLPSGASDVYQASVAEPATDGSIVQMGGGAGGGAVLELAPQGDFLRLDLEIAREMEATMAGRDVVLRPYLRVVNALNRRDALFYYYDRWLGDEARPVATRPVLPLAGIEMRF